MLNLAVISFQLKKNASHVSLPKNKILIFQLGIYNFLRYCLNSYFQQYHTASLEKLFMYPVWPTFEANCHLSNKMSYAFWSTHSLSSSWNDLFLISTCWNPIRSPRLTLTSSSLGGHHWSSQENLISLSSISPFNTSFVSFTPYYALLYLNDYSLNLNTHYVRYSSSKFLLLLYLYINVLYVNLHNLHKNPKRLLLATLLMRELRYQEISQFDQS